MALIGGQINTSNYPQPDYSGVVNAGQMQAQGLANIGAGIGKVIDNFSQVKKEQKKVDAYNKASAKSIEAAITLGESYKIKGVKETLNPFLESYNDPNLSPIEKAALLDEGKAMIPNVFGRFDRNQAMLIEQAQNEAATNAAKARAEAAAGAAPPIEKFGTPTGFLQLQWNPQTRSYEHPRINLQGGNQPQATTQNQIDEALAIGLMPKNDGTEGLPPVGDFEATNMLLNGTDQIGFTPNEQLEVAKPLTLEQKKQFGLPDDKQYVAKFKGNEIISIPEIIKLPEQAVKFRPATPEESKPFGGMEGQIDESTGRFYPVAESAPELKLKLLKKAAEFYSKNNKVEALQYATAAGIGGLFGNLTISDLDDYFGSGAAPAVSNPASSAPATPTPVVPVAPAARRPIDQLIPIPK